MSDSFLTLQRTMEDYAHAITRLAPFPKEMDRVSIEYIIVMMTQLSASFEEFRVWTQFLEDNVDKEYTQGDAVKIWEKFPKSEWVNKHIQLDTHNQKVTKEILKWLEH